MRRKILFLFYREPRVDGYYNTYKHYVFLNACKEKFNVRYLTYEKIVDGKLVTPKDAPGTINKIGNLFLGKSSRITHYQSKSFFREYLSILNEFNPDIIYVEHVVMMQFILRKTNGAKIVFYDDESVLFQKSIGLLHGLKEQVKNFNLEKLEYQGLKSSNLILTITDEERDFLKNLTNNRVVTVSWPIDLSKYSYSFNPYNDKRFNILFVGNFSHYPNREAAKIIVKEIFPKFKNNKKTVFTIVGINTQRIKNILPKGIIVFENVPDVKPFLERADLFIAPIFSGSGMRIKILEAAAIGVPLLISETANFGFNFENNKECIIAENKNEFAFMIEKIINKSKKEMREISLNARKIIELNFSREVIGKKFINYLEELFD